MSPAEIANLEHASRSATAWLPEGYDGRSHYTALLAAILPAIGILAVASSFLFSIA